MKKLVIFFISTALIFSIYSGASATPFQDPAAAAVILVETNTGRILHETNMHQRHPTDGFARVMTLLLAVYAIETGTVQMNDVVTMTESALEGVPSRATTLNIALGEEMTLRDLMFSAFLGEAAEACNMIAEHIAGSTEAFVELMNERASELGCLGTNFTNAHGWHSPEQFTTAFDQHLIFREAMNYPLFAEIAGTHRHTIEATNLSDARTLTGSNPMLNVGGFYYFTHCTAGVASISFEGGYSLIAAAENNGLTLIAVVLGSDTVYRGDGGFLMRNLSEARRLFDWGFSQFAWRVILSSNELVTNTAVTHGAGADFVNLRPETQLERLLEAYVTPDDFDRHITIFSEENNERLYAPISAGQVLGEITLTRNGEYYGTVTLVANTGVDLHRFQFLTSQVRDALLSQTARVIMLVLVLIIVGYAALVIRYNKIRRAQKIKAAETKRRIIEENQREFERQQELNRQKNRADLLRELEHFPPRDDKDKE